MWFNLSILASALPIGWILSKMAEEELIPGRNWFILSMFFSAILGIWAYLENAKYIFLTFSFIFIMVSVFLLKSYSK